MRARERKHADGIRNSRGAPLLRRGVRPFALRLSLSSSFPIISTKLRRMHFIHSYRTNKHAVRIRHAPVCASRTTTRNEMKGAGGLRRATLISMAVHEPYTVSIWANLEWAFSFDGGDTKIAFEVLSILYVEWNNAHARARARTRAKPKIPWWCPIKARLHDPNTRDIRIDV